ncbi:MAG: outer membrane beta-barrel protein [bacterium]|jgi:opacity protein-like surface antigen
MKRFSLALLLLLAVSATAFGQLGEIWLNFGKTNARNNSLSTVDFGEGLGDLTYDTGFRFDARLTLNNDAFFGHEFGYAYNRGKVKLGGEDYFNMSAHQGMYNFLLYATPEGSPIRPFATGGGHFTAFYPPGSNIFSGHSETKFGFNYGGGVKVRVGDKWAVRLDVRDYWQGKPDFGTRPEGLLKLLVVSAGFGLVF